MCKTGQSVVALVVCGGTTVPAGWLAGWLAGWGGFAWTDQGRLVGMGMGHVVALALFYYRYWVLLPVIFLQTFLLTGVCCFFYKDPLLARFWGRVLVDLGGGEP